VTAALRRNAIAQVALIWWSPRLFCGTPFISSVRSGRFANRGAKSTMAYSSMWRRPIGTTSTSQAIIPSIRANASRREGSGATQVAAPGLAYFISPFVKRPLMGWANCYLH
jgi:hypothetical protein